MPRNAEVIRQWTILGRIERSRGAGVTIDELAEDTGVTTRTIRRDLEALQESGFPLFDDRSADDGRTRWHASGHPFKDLVTSLTLAELSALYFSRSLVETLAGTPFGDDLAHAFDKLASVLTPHMRRFLDRLPRVIAAKRDPRRVVHDPRLQALVAKALDAIVHLRQVALTYHSKSSGRTKTYRVHPYRLAYAQGGLYLLAHVPEYDEVRTFALQRIEQLSVLDEHFPDVPAADDRADAFPDSLGVHTGPTERVEILFDRGVAPYVRSREWHRSQRLDDQPDGSVRVTLEVSVDDALMAWILGFGAAAQVAAPAYLVSRVAGELDRALARYHAML